MVAYTPNLCLPCLEATDPLCIDDECGTNVWCDMADILESRLNAMDAVLGRAASAVPLAMVSMLSTIPAVTNQYVSWEQVDVDTDNMVDLSVLPTLVTPTRPGVYVAQAVAAFRGSSGLAADGPALQIIIENPAASTVVSPFDEGRSSPDQTDVIGSRRVSATMVLPTTADLSASSFSVRLKSFIASDVTEVRMTVRWVCDL